MCILGNIRGLGSIFRQFLRDLAATSRPRAAYALVCCYHCSDVVRIKFPVKFATQIGRSSASRVTVHRLVATGICQVIDNRFQVRALIYLSRSSDLRATIVK